MQLRVFIDGVDVSSFAMIDSTEIVQELSGRVATARIRFLIQGASTRYDVAEYDESEYANLIAGLVNSLAEITVENEDEERIFGGYIVKVSYDRITPGTLFLDVDCTSFGLTLETTIVNQSFTSSNDRTIIQAAMAGTGISATSGNVALLQSISSYEAKDISVRQVLDDICSLTGAEWFVDFHKNLKYRTATAETAPFGFSDTSSSFSWMVERYSTDFTNPANRITVIGGLASGGTNLSATVNDTASQAAYGVQAVTIVDRNIRDASLLSLRGNVELSRRAFPEVSGTIRYYQDGLAIGQAISVVSSSYGINGTFAIRRLSMKQKTSEDTEYILEFGQYRPDLSQMLARLNRASKDSSTTPQGIPPDNSVDGDMIQDDSITGDHFADASISGTKIANATISGTNIQSATISGTHIQSATISGSHIASGTIVSGNIASSTITGGNIASSTITGGNLASQTITAAEIQNLTITSAQIQNLTINGSKISDNAITNEKVSSATLTGDKLVNATITSLQIANSTITGSKIASATIAGSNIQSATISGTNIQSATLVGSHLQSATITGSNIASLTINTSNIADLAITNAKINSLDVSKLTAGTISAAVSMTAPTITSTSGSNTISLSNGRVQSSYFTLRATLESGYLNISDTASSALVELSTGQVRFIDSSGVTVFRANNFNFRLERELLMGGTTVVNTSAVFTGNGVYCPSYGVAASGFNPYNGTQYYGQTATVVGSFTIGGVPKTNLVFVGGALVSYS